MSQKKRLKSWVERENKRRHQSGKGAGLSLSTNSRTKHIFLELIMVTGSNSYVSFSVFFSFSFFLLFSFLFDGFVFCFMPVPHSPIGRIGHKGKQKRRRRTLRESSSLRQSNLSRTLKAKEIQLFHSLWL